MRMKLGTLTLALAAGGALPALAQTCTPTAITPYISVNGAWAQTASATLKTGDSAIFGPQPVSGGMWSWSGCGTAGASREQTISPTTACTATATYTNACGAKSTQTFSIKVGAWASAKFGGGGYVTGLVFHPTTRDLLYARTDVGGAYRWDASTSSWLPITDGFTASEGFHHGVESIALDPNNDQRVYMVTGMYASADATARLYISSNRGTSWTSVNLPFSAGGNNLGRAIGERLSIDPNNPSILFYASRTAGLWKSSDSGLTWAQTSLSSTKMTQDQINNLGGQVMGVEQLIFDTSTKGSGSPTWIMWATIAPDYASASGLSSNLYKSVNGGATWTPVTTPVPGYHIPHVVRASDGAFYVLFTKGAGPGDGGPGRLYKFDGGGGNWTLLRSNDSAGYGGISVSGTGSTARIALGVSGTWGDYSGKQIVQLSDNGGQTWREIEAGMPGQGASGWVDDVEIDPSNRDHVMHVHGGGIVETRNASAATPTWNFAINGLEETCTLGLRTPPAGAPYIFLNSSGDVGTWVHTNLATAPTLSPYKQWNSGNSADMAWSDPNYIAAGGVINSSNTGTGYWSGDGGQTWAAFATLPAGAATKTSEASNLAVTARNRVVWAPADSVPSYTTDNGATWTATNLPALAVQNGVPRSYRLVADRRNPNKVYAYDSGGAWWTYTQAKVYVSTDGGHNFTLSQGSVAANMRFAPWGASSMAVNPNAEGDLWVADGLAVYHSMDSGANWTKLNNFAAIWNGRNDWLGPEVPGASIVALGKPKAGATYSAAVYVVGVVNGVWGVYRSDDGGISWVRHNDDAHQYAGVGVMAADHNAYGRIYVGGTCRGVLYSN